LMPGRDLCGDLVLSDIGIPSGVLDDVRPRTLLNSPALWSLPPIAADAHKYSRGHVTVLGGQELTGAARLAADAARKTGAGLVTIAARGSVDTYRGHSAGIMVTESPIEELLGDRRREIWICGPGLGSSQVRAIWPRLISTARKVVGDADTFT